MELKKNLRLTKAALFENAIHECAHAVIATHLGVIKPGGKTKVWAGGRGGLKLKTWYGKVDFQAAERKSMLIALMAGEKAQFKSLQGFSEKGWESDPGTLWMRAKGPQSQYDRDEIKRLLSQFSADEGIQLSLLLECAKATQELVDQHWPLILKVARSLLRARHLSLSNKQVIRLVSLSKPGRI